MNSRRPSLVSRALTQMDLAFWYLHAHPGPLAVLSIPVLVAISAVAVSIVVIVQTWELPGVVAYFLFGIVTPAIVVWLFAFAPLPSAAFAWRRAGGSVPETSDCFAYCWSRRGRLARLSVSLFLIYLSWFLFAGLPLLVFWPRTSVAPVVALFDPDPRVFQRARRLLKEDLAIRVLAGLYLCVFIALGVLLFLPRLLMSLLGHGAGGAIGTGGSRWIWNHLWVAEILGGGVLLALMSVGWCISITLLYRSIRFEREGEPLRKKIDLLRAELFRDQPAELPR